MARPKLKYTIEDIVSLKTDPEKLPRMITRFTVSKDSISYELSYGTQQSWHFDFEIEGSENKKAVIGYGRHQ